MGDNASTSDTAVFNRIWLKEDFEDDSMGLPAADQHPGDDLTTSYFLADEYIFPAASQSR